MILEAAARPSIRETLAEARRLTTENPPDESSAMAVRTPARRKRKRRPLLFIACWGYLLGAIALCVLLRAQGDRSWTATFLMFAPRWPFALPFLLLLPWALLTRRWILGSAALGGLSVIAGPVMGFNLALPIAESERRDLRLLTFNVHRQHVDIGKFSAMIAESRPDVVAVQDWSSALEKPLFATGGWYTKHVGELYLASRFPIGKVTPLDFNDSDGVPKAERGSCVAFELDTPQGKICVINLHLASPHTALNMLTNGGGNELTRNALRRWSESEKVRAMVDGIGLPVVVTGDFNTTDDSPIFREHWQDFADAFVERGFGLGFTYLNDHTQLRIDHVLSDASWKTLRATVGPEAGSPHRPLIVDLQRQ